MVNDEYFTVHLILLNNNNFTVFLFLRENYTSAMHVAVFFPESKAPYFSEIFQLPQTVLFRVVRSFRPNPQIGLHQIGPNYPQIGPWQYSFRLKQ